MNNSIAGKVALKDPKACVRYFISNFHFSPNDSISKTMENAFYFTLKALFVLEMFQVFVASSSPRFFPISHCFRGWFKENVKVYNFINCRNKNLIIHFVWYLEKEIKCDIETLSIDRVLNTKYFSEKIIQEMRTKS